MTSGKDTTDLDALSPDGGTESERVVLAAVLREPARLDDLARLVREDDFADGLCRALYGILDAQVRAGRPADLQTVRECFARAHPGHFASLNELVAVTRELADGFAGNAEHHARRVHGRGTLRRLRAAGEKIADLARRADGPPEDLLRQAGEALAAVDDAAGSAEAVPLSSALHDMIAAMHDRWEAGRPSSLPSGLGELDGITGGLRKGELITLAARPGVGKTSIGLGVARAAAEAGHPALFASVEMGRVELAERLVASRLSIDARLLHEHDQDRLPRGLWGDVLDARRDLARLPLHLDDVPSQTPAHVARQARRLKRQGGLDLAVVDYLGLLAVPDGRGQKKRHELVGELTRELKMAARQLGLPVLLLAQLNREVESRGEKARPRLSDLRESGSIEQDSDVVIFLWRSEQQPHRNPGDAPPDLVWINCEVAKNRNGQTGALPLVFHRPSTTFTTAPLSDPRRKA